MNFSFSDFKLIIPGASYWFKVSLVTLFYVSFQSLMSGTFPLVFVIGSLMFMGLAGAVWPNESAEAFLRKPGIFIAYVLLLMVMCNTQAYLGHRLSPTGVFSVMFAGIVAFFLGRYGRIGYLGLADHPPASHVSNDVEDLFTPSKAPSHLS